MKVLVNGGLNVSELDGWWAETYSPQIGWSLGDGKEHDNDPAWDGTEAGRLYELLKSELIPEFYTRDAQGIPRAWVKRVRESMAQLTPRFSANRSVREYVGRCYLPAAAAYPRRARERGSAGVAIANHLRTIEEGWPTLRFGRLETETRDALHQCAVEVYRGALDPGAILVPLYAEPLEMRPDADPSGIAGMDVYCASTPATREHGDYTPRIVPADAEIVVPLEAWQILWQR